MSLWYLDTSAAMKLVFEETESAVLARCIDDEQPDLVACWLLETEMRRVAQREPILTQQIVSEFLEGVGLFEVPSSLFREAGVLPGAHLRTLDALHLTAAIRIGVDRVVTYDSRMQESARSLGLNVFAPA